MHAAWIQQQEMQQQFIGPCVLYACVHALSSPDRPIQLWRDEADDTAATDGQVEDASLDTDGRLMRAQQTLKLFVVFGNLTGNPTVRWPKRCAVAVQARPGVGERMHGARRSRRPIHAAEIVGHVLRFARGRHCKSWQSNVSTSMPRLAILVRSVRRLSSMIAAVRLVWRWLYSDHVVSGWRRSQSGAITREDCFIDCHTISRFPQFRRGLNGS